MQIQESGVADKRAVESETMLDVRPSADSDIGSLVRENALIQLRFVAEPQRSQLFSWLCDQIQTERNAWKRRVDSSLKEIERYRKQALINDGLLQKIREKNVRVLGQAGCEVEQNSSIEDIVSRTCEICSFLVDDQSRCYSLIEPSRNVDNQTLSDILQEKLDELEKEIQNLKSREKEAETMMEFEDKFHNPPTPPRLPTPKPEPEKVLTKEKSTLVKGTVFTFDKMSLKMLVDSSRDGPMSRAKRFHEMETKLENLHDKIKILETELERKTREIAKYKSHIRMLKRMYHYDNNIMNNSLAVSQRKEQFQVQNEVNGLSVIKQTPREPDLSESPSISTDDISPLIANARTSVSRCLRCQRLYRLQDNHKKACHYHPKPKKKYEKYTSSGRLVNVLFVYECCKRDGDQEGCCTDQHI